MLTGSRSFAGTRAPGTRPRRSEVGSFVEGSMVDGEMNVGNRGKRGGREAGKQGKGQEAGSERGRGMVMEGSRPNVSPQVECMRLRPHSLLSGTRDQLIAGGLSADVCINDLEPPAQQVRCLCPGHTTRRAILIRYPHQTP
eukprot:3016354-Rhodomonas_salina.1